MGSLFGKRKESDKSNQDGNRVDSSRNNNPGDASYTNSLQSIDPMSPFSHPSDEGEHHWTGSHEDVGGPGPPAVPPRAYPPLAPKQPQEGTKNESAYDVLGNEEDKKDKKGKKDKKDKKGRKGRKGRKDKKDKKDKNNIPEIKEISEAKEILEEKKIQEKKEISEEKKIQEKKEISEEKDIPEEKKTQERKEISKEKKFPEEKKTEEKKEISEEKEMEGNPSTEWQAPEYYAGLECQPWPTGPKVRIDKDYDAHSTTDFSCKRGDILLLLDERADNDRYHVMNLSSGKKGHVPTNLVTKITDDDAESQTCLFRWLTRVEAEEKLLEPGIEQGTYLLRPSNGGDYALSLRCNNLRTGQLEIRHYKIRVVAKGECFIDATPRSKTFRHCTELIKCYTEMPGLRCKLKWPLPQEIQLDDLAVNYSELELGEKIGSGNFGLVYAGTLRKKEQVAVKSLKAGSAMTVDEFRKEAETMHKLRHPRLVSLLAICEGGGNLHIITEIMSKGALLELLRRDTDHVIKFADIMDMAIQVVEGMWFLESKSFVHRDLRAANVLVGEGSIAKIADFGLTRLLDNYYQHEDFYKDKKGSVFPYKWTAPEAINYKTFTVKSDVWSFGILLYEMVTHGNEPYATMSSHGAHEWVEEGNRMKKPTKHHCPEELYKIMTHCWMENPTDRPNFEYIKTGLEKIRANA